MAANVLTFGAMQKNEIIPTRGAHPFSTADKINYFDEIISNVAINFKTLFLTHF